ncbi:MAG TPA: GNAT family N-acetyltransferase [Gaiellaceae bacterium]|nr:GNAT family N-acetyltransferase [Gaiellaceae bacterium]
MRVVEYDSSRRTDVAGLMGRVWGKRPDEEDLAWFYERNPVRRASVLLAEEDGTTIGTTALSFARMSIAGEQVEIGMAVRLATDPAFRGRGVFAALMAEQERRAGELGIPLLLSVTNAASTPILAGPLGWSRLEPIRAWARAKILRGSTWTRPVKRFEGDPPEPRQPVTGDRVLRDGAWLNWRFADGPGTYTCLVEEGYAVSGRWRGMGVVAVAAGDLIRDAASAGGGPVILAAPPRSERNRYILSGFVPTPKTFTVVGKSLDPRVPLPAAPHFELGDLDFL